MPRKPETEMMGSDIDGFYGLIGSIRIDARLYMLRQIFIRKPGILERRNAADADF